MSSILTETFEGVPGGMNLALPAQELDDTEARYVQDALLHLPGLVVRRGGATALGGIVSFPDKFTDFFYTFDPQGTVRIGALSGDNTKGNLEACSGDLLQKNQIPWDMNLPNNPAGGQPYAHSDVKPGLKGGVLIGTSQMFDSSTTGQCLGIWRGATKTNYTTGTITVARGSTAVSGVGTSFANNVVPGMFLFANTDDPYTDTFIGTVLAVVDNTTLTLTDAALHPVTGRSFTLRSVRGLSVRVAKGRITCGTAATTITGGATKFIDQGLNVGTWQIYRASDLAFVGKVSTVNSNISITCAANCAVAMANERFIAIKVDTFANEYGLSTLTSARKLGFLTSVYAGRQWYANNGGALDRTARVWFSETSDPEAVDMATFDGDFINVDSTKGALQPVCAIRAAYNSLIVFKESETFGIFGSSPTNFQLRKISDDGAVDGASVQGWGGGVIWAGREGINFFDGTQVTNLADAKLGQYWKDTIKSFSASRYRMWSTVIRDHYILHIDNVNPTYVPIKGNTSSQLSKLCVVVNMNTRAFAMWTNMGIRGSVQLPSASGGGTYVALNGTSSATSGAWIVDATTLFDTEGVDTILCDGEPTPGPDFFIESKKFSAGDSLRKKLFKQLAIYYLCQGGNLRIDTVIGLNDIGKTSLTVFPPTELTWDQLSTLFASWDALAAQYSTWDALTNSVFAPKRVKFLKRSQHLSFRIWQETGNLTRVRLGPYQVGYKLMRPGRI